RRLGARPDEVEVVIEPAGVQVAGGGHQRPRVVDGELVERRGAGRIGELGHVGEGESPVDPAVAVDVEHRVDVVVLDIHPDRVHRGDLGGRGRRGGDEVDVVGDVDLGRLGGQVVDHVVQDLGVRGAHGIAVAMKK